ncbi:hypothetical protein QPK32_25155 [Massilia sp. YIM B02763]|uniref:hypothetical protein n=1 Tax=Massilia sp. YIM B02763 TaxID=3050130 RepID=UPI0025B6E178|nr:hypothetical protein [Massilia sp. YIM B02763]MDN4056360.1 hypothetical protein [Massilia sp. YIM B02763]
MNTTNTNYGGIDLNQLPSDLVAAGILTDIGCRALRDGDYVQADLQFIARLIEFGRMQATTSAASADGEEERGSTRAAALAADNKTYTYEINPRPDELGGGWNLRMLHDGMEVGGGVFPVVADEAAGIAWWNGLGEEDRAWHLQQCAPALPTAANAYRAHLLVEAYNDAEETAANWLDSRTT